MNKQALMAFLAALVLAGSARAQAIPFFNVQYEATAIALASDGPAGFDTTSGVLGPDLITSSADSIGTTDSATAGAIVAPGLLSTSADVSAAAGASSAVATAHFVGSFLSGGLTTLSLDFFGLDVASGSGGASTTLFVSLTNNGVTLFENFVQGPWVFGYSSLAGSTSVLDLTLASEVNAAFQTPGAGNASSFGIVTIAAVVPEPSTWLLLALGLGGVVMVSARAQRRAARV